MKKETYARKYLDELKNETIKLPKIREGATHIWHQFVIRCDSLIKYLKERGIGAIIRYPIPRIYQRRTAI